MANENNPVLAELARNWLDRYGVEPITVLRSGLETNIAYTTIIVAELCLLAGSVWLAFWTPAIEILNSALPAEKNIEAWMLVAQKIGLSAFIPSLFGLIAKQVATKYWPITPHFKSAQESGDSFLKGLNLLLSATSQGISVFREPSGLATLNDAASRLLCGQAQSLVEIQGIPWRHIESLDHKSAFEFNVRILSALTKRTPDVRPYFQGAN